jgi:nitroimidazol reductase NimA-like FMN-containing flavoprotein (pyridoxamine 5'-phosphate oxidase superfamily)
MTDRSASVEGTPRPALAPLSLDRADCLKLLAAGGRGRVAATMRAVPVIIPVTFTLSGEDVLFSPDSGPDVVRAVADAVVAFETDAIGSDGRAVWDVHVTGVAKSLSSGTEPPHFRLSSEVMSGWQQGIDGIELGH